MVSVLTVAKGYVTMLKRGFNITFGYVRSVIIFLGYKNVIVEKGVICI